MNTVGVMINRELSSYAKLVLSNMAAAASENFKVRIEKSDSPCDIQVLWGVGAPLQASVFKRARERGTDVVCIDVGYAQDKPGPRRRFRISLNHPHPVFLDNTRSRGSRWDLHVEESPTLGDRVLLVDMGPKSVVQYGLRDWASRKLSDLLSRGYSRQEIIYRPKPKNPFTPLPGVAFDHTSSIESLLRKSKLVVSHHSNVCVYAVAAGVPIECEDGAATWLRGKEWSYENRRDFINRLSRWQYEPGECREAWKFIQELLK